MVTTDHMDTYLGLDQQQANIWQILPDHIAFTLALNSWENYCTDPLVIILVGKELWAQRT